MIEISNNGAAIASTNYFDTEHALAGLYYLSWNASAARILVPDIRVATIEDMRTTKRWVVISRGKIEGVDAVELLFDDQTADPFAIHLDLRQCDRDVPDDHKPFTVAAWTREGLIASWPGRYRRVEKLPALEPWVEH